VATFVLVHGAWAGGLIWRPVAQGLRQAGHDVFTPTLTGLGERKHLLSRDIDLGTHIKDVLSLIEYEDLADIVLVGHSYGGMVVTGVADAVPDKIASLVYLDAFVPENGRALVDLLPPDAPRSAPVPGTEWLAAPLPVEAFGELSEEARLFSERKTSPHPIACFTQPLSIVGGIDRIEHKIYIYCNDREPTMFTPFYDKLKSKPRWTVITLPCTHVAQMDMPGELTEILIQVQATPRPVTQPVMASPQSSSGIVSCLPSAPRCQ
jgi:pimeloyl-ACP methyl ester carboxylesterase